MRALATRVADRGISTDMDVTAVEIDTGLTETLHATLTASADLVSGHLRFQIVAGDFIEWAANLLDEEMLATMPRV